ncbi:CopD family protein [Duganella sp. CT11-25]|uniref:CopD family protein n=1 Tax=unclassified Duganella TaxID=2636909 RepID=UPI0039AF7E81
MISAALLQGASALLLNLALAWLLAGGLAVRWLRDTGQPWSAAAQAQLRKSMPAAALLGLLAYGGSLWAAAAAMADVPLDEAGEALSMLLSSSSYGRIGTAGCLALLLTVALHGVGRRLPGRDWIALALLAACAFSRAANSHAAEHGMLSLGVLVEWLHLLLICVWVGAVFAAGWLILPLAARQAGAASARYLGSLSDAATLALVGIGASGLYNAWRVFGAWDKVGAGTYETTLAVKLLLVLLAVALGGHNKFFGFPAAIAARAGALPRVTFLLQVESLLLAGAMLAAVMLAGLPPPASI